MPGEGREELVKHLDRLAGEKRAKEEEERRKQQAAGEFESRVVSAFSRIKPKLEEAVGLLEARGQGASVDRVGDLALVLLVAIEGQQSRLIFQGDEAAGKVKVSCHLVGKVGKELAAYPPDGVTPAVAEAHLDYFYRGLASGRPLIQAWQRFRALSLWWKGDGAAHLKILVPRAAVSAAAVAGSILFLWFIRSQDPLGASRAFEAPIAEVFFSVFGLVYAIIVGLFIIEAHRRMRDLSSVVQSELNAVGDLVDFLRYFGEEKQDAGGSNVRKRLATYAEKLIEDLMQPNQPRQRHTEERRKEITDIIDAVKELKPQGKASEDALDAIVRKIADLTTFRSQKTEIARRGFPWPFYGLLVLMTLVVVVGFSLMDVRAALHGVLISVTALALSWLSMLVWDVDHPLEGYWNIREEVSSNVAEITGRLEAS